MIGDVGFRLKRTVLRNGSFACASLPPSPPMARILLIDDDDPLRAALRESLEYAGHSVVEASEGAAGLALFDEHPFDLIITDLLMPGKEGVEVLMEIRKRKSPVKTLAISGGGARADLSYLQIAKVMGATEVLPKPFTARTLVETVDRVLGINPPATS